jgi:adenylate cyclase
MNIYLSEMTEIIMAAGGTLDKYEGDAIIAFWNAPLDDPAHALRACRAALACQKRTRELNPDLRKNFGHEIRMRIGLNTGPAVVGNMGSRRRFDYTAIGDTVNLASRLEGACKQYRIFLLIGETTRERAGDAFLVREADFVRVVGRVQPVRIFELLGERDDVPPAEIEAVRTYGRALESFRRRRWDQAGELFRSLGKDPLAAIYIERSEVFLRNPPPAEWDGVVELKTK